MSLQYRTKAGSLTNLTDARYFNAQGAEWLGFNMDVLDPNSVSMKDLIEIKKWLFEPKIVLECGHHQDKTELIYLANELFAEAVQVDLDHPLLKEDHFLYPVFVTLKFDELHRSKTRSKLKALDAVEAVILSADRENFNWAELKKQSKSKIKAIEKLKRDYTVLLDLPFQPDWFLEAAELLKPTGIHISCSKEERPGISKVDEYDVLLALIEVEDEF